MTNSASPRISSRKQPKQARSAELVAAILNAAVQVLESEGARRFTTARVAERAGVSVGSLYQYFPNKASILFRLQTDEWRQTSKLLQDILENREQPPLDRLRTLVEAFIRSECDEASMRIALDDAAPLYRDAPEARSAREASALIFRAFMQDVLPDVAEDVRDRAAELIQTTMSQVGKSFSETPRTEDEAVRYAGAMADMFCAYIERLERG